VVSNAAFYELAADQRRSSKTAREPLQIGFLSNIAAEKGFTDFFDILAQLKQRGIAYFAHIAGPVAPDAQDQFSKLLSASENTKYLGPIYGDDKDRFYRLLDLFIFPTRYTNEAEPLVLHEALRAGAHVIACDRGAIAEMLSNGAGLVFSTEALVAAAVRQIEIFSADPASLAAAQEMSLRQAHRIRARSGTDLEQLLRTIAGEQPG